MRACILVAVEKTDPVQVWGKWTLYGKCVRNKILCLCGLLTVLKNGL